jgi:hypothetical protein
MLAPVVWAVTPRVSRTRRPRINHQYVDSLRRQRRTQAACIGGQAVLTGAVDGRPRIADVTRKRGNKDERSAARDLAGAQQGCGQVKRGTQVDVQYGLLPGKVRLPKGANTVDAGMQ